MKIDITSLDGEAKGSIDLDDAIFGLVPREDLIARMVRYQLAKRRAGTHQTLGRADIWRTGKKLYKQKGTGAARHGSARVPQFRGGGRAFGPLVRSHAHDLPKKLRALALAALAAVATASLSAPPRRAKCLWSRCCSANMPARLMWTCRIKGLRRSSPRCRAPTLLPAA